MRFFSIRLFTGSSFCRRGFFLPLVIMGVVSVAFFVTFVHYMSQGYSSQVEHLDEFSRAQSVAESLLAKIQARLHTKRWQERFFSPAPYYETGVSDDGGAFELYVLDAPGRNFEMDIYAQVRYKRAKRLFFWRLRHETSILDAAGRNFPLVFTATAPKTLNTGGSPLGDFVDKVLETRKSNGPDATAKSTLLKTLTSTKDIISALDGPPTTNVPDEETQGSDLPPTGGLTPPPPPPVTTVYGETFDDLPVGDCLIPGFSYINNDVSRKGAIVRTRSSSPPGCYEFEDSTNQYIAVSVGNRFVYEFDHSITKPGPGDVPSWRTHCFGPIYSVGARNRFMYNNIKFKAADKKVYFVSDDSSTDPADSAYLCEWNMDRFTNFRVDLNFDDLTADVYVNGNKVVDRFSIRPKSLPKVDPDTGQMVTANMDHFEVHGHTYPYQSSIDNLRLSK